MNSEDSITINQILIKTSEIKDQFQTTVGSVIDSVIQHRPNITFYSDLHYNIHATVAKSKIQYRLIGDFKSLNDEALVSSDYNVENWQVKGMEIEYIIWNKNQ